MLKKIFLFSFCFFIALGFSASADLNEGLISAWTFDDGTARDSLENSDGEINNANAVDGKFLKGLDFNGKDSFVRIPHHPSMEVIEDSFSVSAWAFIRSFPQPNHAGIVFKGQKIGWSQDYAFRMATREVNQLTWAVPKPGTEGNFNSDNAAKDGEWTFVCLTADGTGAKAYVATENEVPRMVGSNGQAAPYQTRVGDPIEIGVGRARDGVVGNDIFFDGIIDEVYLWGRAISEDELADLANGNRPSIVILAVESTGKLATTWGSVKH